MLTSGENNRRLSLKLKLIRLRDIAYREHYECEDCFYSCPKSVDSCSPSNKHDTLEQECMCGADNHNNKVSELYLEILESME